MESLQVSLSLSAIAFLIDVEVSWLPVEWSDPIIDSDITLVIVIALTVNIPIAIDIVVSVCIATLTYTLIIAFLKILLLVARVDSDMTVIPIIVFIFADTSRTPYIVNIIFRIFIMIIFDDMTIALTAVNTGTLRIIYIAIDTVLS